MLSAAKRLSHEMVLPQSSRNNVGEDGIMTL